MDKERVKKLLRLYAMPAFLIVLGLVLVFSPDTASAFVAKIIGWLIIVIGAVGLLWAILGASYERPRQMVFSVLCLGLGIFIVSFPMVLAEALGRFFGIFLTIQGAGDIRRALQKKNAGFPYRYSLGVAVVTLIAGVVLALLPMTLSRIILNICGVVLVVIGVVNTVGTYQEQKLPENRGRPDIIDADE